MHSLPTAERQNWEFYCQMNTCGGNTGQQHLHLSADAEVPARLEDSAAIFRSWHNWQMSQLSRFTLAGKRVNGAAAACWVCRCFTCQGLQSASLGLRIYLLLDCRLRKPLALGWPHWEFTLGSLSGTAPMTRSGNAGHWQVGRISWRQL